MDFEKEEASDTFSLPYRYVFKFLLQNYLHKKRLSPRDLFHNLIQATERVSEEVFPSRDYLLSFPPSLEELQDMIEDIKHLHERMQVELGSRVRDMIFQDTELVMTFNLIEERIENFRELQDINLRARILERLAKYGYGDQGSLLQILDS